MQNLYDFTYALRAHKPGDQVDVEVLRGGKTFTATVHLTERKYDKPDPRTATSSRRFRAQPGDFRTLIV